MPVNSCIGGRLADQTSRRSQRKSLVLDSFASHSFDHCFFPWHLLVCSAKRCPSITDKVRVLNLYFFVKIAAGQFQGTRKQMWPKAVATSKTASAESEFELNCSPTGRSAQRLRQEKVHKEGLQDKDDFSDLGEAIYAETQDRPETAQQPDRNSALRKKAVF